MKRAIALLVAALMATSLFAGCGKSSDTAADVKSTQVTNAAEESKTEEVKEEVKITGNITFATNRTDKADNTLKDMAQKFMEKYPGTTVEIEGLQGEAIENIIKTRMAANELPDVTPVLGTVKSTDYPNYFASLDDLGYTKDNVYFFNAGQGPDGKFYAMSSSVDYQGITYNKKVFADAGITSIPKTLDELFAACDKIKAKGIVPIASNFKDAWPMGWYTNMYAIMNTGNASYMNELKDKNEIYSDDGGLLAGCQLTRTLKEKGYFEEDLMSTSWDGMRKDLPAGKFAMVYLGSWYPPQFIDMGGKKEDVGMFPFPGVKGIALNPGWKLAVASNSKNMDTAKEFFKFMFTDNIYNNAVGELPSLIGVKTDSPWVEELLSYGVPVIEAVPDDPDYLSIVNKAQIDYRTVLQDYMTNKNPDDVVKKYNAKWADTKKALGK